MNSIIANIADKARAVLAFEQELNTLEAQIQMENDRHLKQIDILTAKKQAMEQVIFRLMPS